MKELKAKEQKYIEDLAYIMYYPRDLKYIGLFSNNDTNESQTPTSNNKVGTLQEKARQIALNARSKDLESGREDRVDHAINSVHSNVSKPSPSPKRNSISNSSDNDNRESKRQRPSSNFESEPEENIVENNNDDAPIKKERRIERSNTKVALTPPVLSPTLVSQNDKVDATLDPFFTEDIELEKPSKAPQYKVSIGDLRNNSTKKNDRNRKTVIENDGTMTKQELRLLNWQVKVRGRKT